MDPIETTRLVLRPFLPTDWRAIFAIFHDTAVSRYTYYHASEGDSRNWLTAQLKISRTQPLNGLTLAMTLRSNSALIGWIGTGSVWRPSVNRSLLAVDGELELSYALASAYWGQGYMTEAVTAVLAYSFTTLNVPQVTADCAQDNHASRRVMEKAGMVYNGIEQHHERDMSLSTHHRFTLSQAQWQQQTKQTDQTTTTEPTHQ